MKSYFLFSTAAHGLLLAALVVVGTLLSKPRMSYYAIDIMSSLPAGGGITEAPAASAVAVPVPPAPKMARAPKVVARAPVAEEELPDRESLRLLAKLKKKRLAAQNLPAAAPAGGAESSAGADSAEPTGAGRGGAGLAGSGAGIVADAGPAFPYPWYLKAIADRLDRQWHPPQDFEPDTVCQVTFIISRAGGVSESKISKSSGDSLFDQLALRAVLYANPLAPLPNGFPDETLVVHMKFVGRRL